MSSDPIQEKAAAERLYRSYVEFCVSPTQDSVFLWMNSLHSFHDRCRETIRTALFSMPEFVAMKALRNHLHHGSDIGDRLKVVPVENIPIITDLSILCLVDRPQVEAAINAIGSKWQSRDRPIIEGVLKWYGSVVNINPAIFNLMAKLTLLIRDEGVTLTDPAFEKLNAQIDFEIEHGHSHTVSGDLSCHAGNVNDLLKFLMAPK